MNIKIEGYGGNGVITASDILAEAAFAQGYQVKKTELKGMSQRGGHITSDIRYSHQPVLSPTIPQGQEDFIITFDPLEPTDTLITSKGQQPSRQLNLILLAKLSTKLDIQEEHWITAITNNISADATAVFLQHRT